MAGALDGLGYGRALGRFILEDGATLPDAGRTCRRRSPPNRRHPLTAARADLLRAMREQALAGRAASPSSTAGNTPRSWPRRSATACR